MSASDSSALGNRIKELRIKHNLTQEVLANLVGITYSYIGLIENGKRHASKNVLDKIASVLNVHPEELSTLKKIEVKPKDIIQVEVKPVERDYLTELVQFLNSLSDEKLVQDIVAECKNLVQKRLYSLLTPYQYSELKPVFMEAKRAWSNLEDPSLQSKDLNGYILMDERTNIYFQLALQNEALQLTLLHGDRKHVTSFESWLYTVSLSYPADAQLPFLNHENKAISFVWFSPALSTLDKLSFLQKSNVPLSKIETNDEQLKWLISTR